MVPPPALRISGTAYLHIRKAPVRLIASASFHCSSVNVSTVPSGVTAAATFTSVVSAPKVSTAMADRTLRIGRQPRHSPDGQANGLRHLRSPWPPLPLFAPNVGDRHRRSLGGKAPGDGGADLAAAAGYQGNAAAQEARHGRLPLYGLRHGEVPVSVSMTDRRVQPTVAERVGLQFNHLRGIPMGHYLDHHHWLCRRRRCQVHHAGA